MEEVASLGFKSQGTLTSGQRRRSLLLLCSPLPKTSTTSPTSPQRLSQFRIIIGDHKRITDKPSQSLVTGIYLTDNISSCKTPSLSFSPSLTANTHIQSSSRYEAKQQTQSHRGRLPFPLYRQDPDAPVPGHWPNRSRFAWVVGKCASVSTLRTYPRQEPPTSHNSIPTRSQPSRLMILWYMSRDGIINATMNKLASDPNLPPA